ncbi:MAG: S8 family serine peptidase, partial [Burkholderiaceae bacterium]|nr:S8 family serine peptidase [Burkholderiaceae bacterium]
MSNSVELTFDVTADWTIEKINEFFSIKNLEDMGFKGLSSAAIALLKKGEAMTALASVFSARNAGEIAARLAVTLPGAQLLAVTQVGTAVRLVVAHQSASCDAVGRATFGVIGDTIGSFVGPVALAATPFGPAGFVGNFIASALTSGLGGQLGELLWNATKTLAPDDKTCYADLFGLRLGFQARASDGTLGTRPLGDLQAGYLQRPTDVSLTRNASEVVTLSSNVGTPVSRSYASVDVAADANSYVVQRYDTLWSIAQANGWSFSDLLNANPQLSDPNLIHIGQVIHGLGPVATSNTANTSTRTGDAFVGPLAPVIGADGLAVQGVSWQTFVDPSSLARGTTFYDGTTGDTATDGVRPGNIELGHVAGTLQAVEAAAGDLASQQTAGGAAGGVGGAGALLNNAGAATPLVPVDPLVLDLNGDQVQLSDIAHSRAFFDVDNDGMGADGRPTREHTGWVKAETTSGQAFNTDGIVVHDLDGNGVIDGIRETLSEYYAGTPGAQSAAGVRTFANGFAALASLDSNADQRFTRDDSAWSGLRVWVDDNADGLSFKDDNGNGRRDAGEVSELHTWDELGITSIYLAAQTESGLVAQGNDVLARSVFTRNGQDATAMALRFVANPDGHTFTPVSPGAGIAGGAIVTTESAATGAVSRSYTSRNADAAFNESLDVRALGVNHLYGGAGRDTLQGDAAANWLDGGAGADVFNAGAGDDVLLIDAADRPSDIHAGEGRDVIQVIGGEGVNLNMAQAEAEAFVGGAGADLVVAGGRSTVYLRGGAGDDMLIGGAANDIVSGEEGNDLIDGGAGNDLLRGHRGRDEIAGGSGDDVLDGGGDDDWLRAGAGADVLIGGAGDDRLDGGEGVDVAEYAGTHSDYEIARVDAHTWRVTDVRSGAAGSDTLVDVEKLSFKDWSRISLGDAHPMAASDVVRADADGRALSRTGVQRIAASQLLRNDQDMQGQALRIAEVLDARGGAVTLSDQGDVLFTPQPGYSGVMSFRYRVVDASGNATPTVIDETSGSTAQTKATVRLWTSDLPVDPLLLQQDYLSDANVIPVWRDYTGRGLRIAMVESTGPFSTQPEVFDYRHPDLLANVDAIWLNAPVLNPSLSLPQPTNNHATMVAGIIGSARNGQGGVGVAYEASLAGGYLPRADLDRPENWATVLRTFASFKDYDIVNNSWQNVRQGVRPTMSVSFRDAIALGRNGLGTAVVFAAGNQRDKGMDTNLDWTTADRGVIVVAGTGSAPDLGAFVQGVKPYSTPGASILLTAPGANIEAVSRELFTDNGSTFNAAQERGDGTSFATPIVSGVVALMLQANPELGYRDIQTILALSARQTGEAAATDWTFNGAGRWNGGGMHVSHDFGYGMVDALAAVRLAETWQQQSTYYNEQHLHADSGTLSRAVSDDGAMLSSTLTLGSGLAVENAEVTLELSHQRWSDLVVKLVSPSGTSSVLINRPGKPPAGSVVSNGSDGAGDESGSFTLRLNTQRLRGESSAGAWTLQVFDAATGATGTL